MSATVDHLVARAYQDELATRALNQNAILAMDTGTGKTLISVMVLRSKLTAARLKAPQDHRMVAIFIVPHVPLVSQQATFIRQTTQLVVGEYHGAKGVDLWSRVQWEKEFASTDVLVMTAQVFKDILAHAHWKLENVAIIVFDEIHHCSKKHPYARIMSEHYLVMANTAERPHVIGLTASPIFNVKNPIKALAEIEQLSTCRVFVVKDNTQELKQFTFQAKPMHCNYEPPPKKFLTYPGPPAVSLWDHLHSNGLLPSPLLGKEKWYSSARFRYFSTVDALGPFAADLFIYLHIDNVLTELVHGLPNPLFKANDSSEVAKRRAKVEEFRRILELHRVRLFTDNPSTPIPRDWVSPKVLALRDLLADEDASTFRGMIFVSQRHFAACLSIVLPRLDLPGIAPAPLVGHGQGCSADVTRLGTKGMGSNTQERVVKEFRDGTLNLIIATSVGEEGLDFPQCSFVCRFDMPQTLPAYIQSRGRARHSDSKFVLMLENGDNLDRTRAIALENSEPNMKQLYGKKMERRDKGELQDEPDDGVPAEDEPKYTVKTTGATLHASSAISLLNNLCSLIPHDIHTPLPRPQYVMNPNLFMYKVKLPPSLPVPRDKLEFVGEVARSKKAAKRSAAFEAVLELYRLGVFDDHFLPVNRNRGSVTNDIDGKPPVDVDHLQPIMVETLVFDVWGDIWRDGAAGYIHPLEVDGRTEMALVLGNALDGRAGTIWESNRPVSFSIGAGEAIVCSREEKTQALDIMEQYTAFYLGHAVTRKGRGKGKTRVFLVPFDAMKRQPNFAEMERILNAPRTRDWSAAGISELNDVYVQLLADGKLVKVLGVQSNMSVTEALADTTLAKKFASLQKFQPGFGVPVNDPILHCRRVLCTTSSEYRDPILQKQSLLGTEDLFYPQSLCEQVNITSRTLDYFKFLPPLSRYLSDTFRARAAMMLLSLPPLNVDRAAEALMLPSVNASFNNQRLETLGDAFLKLATSIHAFNKFPYKHEGQLSSLRQNSVCNKYLMGRGHALGLGRFMTVEANNHRKWRLNVEETVFDEHGISYVKRNIPRRSIQDCMEALLGAALLSGGVQCALSAGTKMGLCFGGVEAWPVRYAKVEPTPRANICAALEDALGYHFKDQGLVMEAINHPTSATGGATYQRLEFLGDALIDLIVLHYLFEKYPSVGPGRLTRLRARCVCNPTLASIGTKKLGLHKTIETASSQFMRAMKEAADTFASMSYAEVVNSMWRLDIPKALSDVVEALMGAVLVDSNYDYELARDVGLRLLKEPLEYVHPQMPDDPIHEFLKWVGKFGCGQVRFRKASSPGEEDPNAPKNLIYVVVHGVDIEPPVPITYKTSIVGTRSEAAQQAHRLLQDESGPYTLSKLCTCKAEETKKLEEAADTIVDEDALDPETVEGFTTAAKLEYRTEMEGDMRLKVALERLLDAEEEAEVESLVLGQEA